MCKAIQEDEQEAGQMGSTTQEVMQEDNQMVMVTLKDSPEAEQTSEPGREGWTSPKVRQEASGEHGTPLEVGQEAAGVAGTTLESDVGETAQETVNEARLECGGWCAGSEIRGWRSEQGTGNGAAELETNDQDQRPVSGLQDSKPASGQLAGEPGGCKKTATGDCCCTATGDCCNSDGTGDNCHLRTGDCCSSGTGDQCS